ncbi:hypothetical protein I4U23_021970 [Adineta vaga]|nr:hypothetical protein I4U23_021970 [Adineta vaga]
MGSIREAMMGFVRKWPDPCPAFSGLQHCFHSLVIFRLDMIGTGRKAPEMACFPAGSCRIQRPEPVVSVGDRGTSGRPSAPRLLICKRVKRFDDS